MPIDSLASARRLRGPLALALALATAAAACGSDPVAPGSGGTDPGTGGGTSASITLPPAPAPDMPGRGELVSAAAGLRVPRQTVSALLVLTGASRAFSARYDAQPYVVRYRTPG